MKISAAQKTEKTWTALFFLFFGVYLVCSILMTTFFAPFFEGTRYEIMAALCFLLLAGGELLKLRAGKWNTRWLPFLIICLLFALHLDSLGGSSGSGHLLFSDRHHSGLCHSIFRQSLAPGCIRISRSSY